MTKPDSSLITGVDARHFRIGWWALLAYLTLGIALECLHGFKVRWYVDGEADSQYPIPATMTKGLNAAGRDIAIPSSHLPYRGLLGDVRIYGKAISAERTKELYDEQATRRSSIAFEFVD